MSDRDGIIRVVREGGNHPAWRTIRTRRVPIQNGFRGEYDGSDIARFNLRPFISGGMGSSIAIASLIAVRWLREK